MQSKSGGKKEREKWEYCLRQWNDKENEGAKAKC